MSISSLSLIPKFNVSLTITGKPDPVANCSVSNQTHSSFLVSCQPGFDGGLTQVFTLNVFNTGAGAGPSILNMTSKLPNFQVEGLQSEKTFSLTVHSSNLRGESERVRLAASTSKPPALVTSAQDINQVGVGGPGVNLTTIITTPYCGHFQTVRSSLLTSGKNRIIENSIDHLSSARGVDRSGGRHHPGLRHPVRHHVLPGQV